MKRGFKILISELDKNNLTENQMTKLLFEDISDDEKIGDCIFVFGSKKCLKYKFPKSIELYRQKRSNKLLFSGGVIWDGETKSEAELMRDKAIEIGIPEQDILIEKESKHTKENILASLMVLDRTFMLHKVQRIIIITTAYHMRRTYLTLKTYMPAWIQFTLCPVNDQLTRKDNWWLNEKGYNRVVNESRKIIKYIKAGAIEDDIFEC